MKVRELIEQLQKQDPEAEVVYEHQDWYSRVEELRVHKEVDERFFKDKLENVVELI